MRPPADPEVEALLAELAPDEATRAALLEAHRQLEKDLLRLSDPMPPADFLPGVMARVAAAPPRPLTRTEVVTASLIVVATLGLAVAALAAGGGLAGGFGVTLASVLLLMRDGAVALASALGALWVTAALPLVLALSVLLVSSLVALRRLSSPPVKVVS
jgi:hypothetical protein